MNLDDDPTQQCGAVHPLYPNVTCIRFGKCPVDAHLGIRKYTNGVWVFEEWGTAIESETRKRERLLNWEF